MKEQDIRAELLQTTLMVHLNLSIITAEHFSPFYTKMFPGLKIAKNSKCSQTKTSCILNEAMKPALKSSLVEYMRETHFLL